MSDWDPRQTETWDRVFSQVESILKEYGVAYAAKVGDYLLVENNYGWRRVTYSAQNLKMIHPDVIARLQETLRDLPDWEIVAAVDILGTEQSWPLMGLTIRKGEIVDGLQRQYFPEEFRNYKYPNSRSGTGYD